MTRERFAELIAINEEGHRKAWPRGRRLKPDGKNDRFVMQARQGFVTNLTYWKALEKEYFELIEALRLAERRADVAEAKLTLIHASSAPAAAPDNP